MPRTWHVVDNNPISIHASRGGSDMIATRFTIRWRYFNPRFPRGKRPYQKEAIAAVEKISIHASRGGSDLLFSYLLPKYRYFNPRFPRGKRPGGRHKSLLPNEEISIHASRGGSDNLHVALSNGIVVISIHASRGGSDARRSPPLTFLFIFQSTLPAGEATALDPYLEQIAKISIHASRGGSDIARKNSFTTSARFQSTLPAGEATHGLWAARSSARHFNPRFPRGKRQYGQAVP